MTYFGRSALAGVAALMLCLLLPGGVLAFEYFAKATSITANGENHTFTAGTAIITCKKAEFKWTGTEGAHSVLDITPAYKECKISSTGALVTNEKAQFEFGAPKEVKKEEFSMTSSIIGEAGAKLKVTATIGSEKCEVDFLVQKLMGETTHFINISGTVGEVQAKIEKIEYTSNGQCNGKVSEKGTNGKYEGNASETGLVVK